MPFLAAAAPALAAGVGTAAASAGINALASGGGGAPVAPIATPQMDPGGFAYGGATAGEGATQAAKVAADQAAGDAQLLQQLVTMGRTMGQQNQSQQAFNALPPDQKARITALMAAGGGDADKAVALANAGVEAAHKNVAAVGAQAGPSFAQQEMGRYGDLAAGAQGRAAPTANLTAYDQSRGLAMGSRGDQVHATDLARGAAEGNAPSAAQGVLQQGLDASNAGASSLAASVRGGGGNLANATRAAMQQQGVNSAQAGQQASILRAQEMAQARAQYGQQATQQRAADLQAQGMDAQTAFAQAQLEAQQRAQNDQMSQGYEAGRRQVGGADLAARSAFQQGQANNALGAGQANAGVAAGNREARYRAGADTANAISTGFGQGANIYGALKGGAPQPAGQASPTAPGTHGGGASYSGGTWKPYADGSGYFNSDGT